METIVRDLRPHLAGRQVDRVVHINPAVLRYPTREAFLQGLGGQLLEGARRRGKFIQLPLRSGDQLVIHLGMTGTLTLDPALRALRAHTHLRLRLDSGAELRFRDPRRFGRVLLGAPQELLEAGVMPRLGSEPLVRGFAESRVGEVLRTSRRAVKAVLLDQAVVAGCGNIYADETCFLARVRPGRRALRLSAVERDRLLRALPLVMRQAIRLRGSSFSDYRDGFGARGEAYEALFVYGRGGLPCIRCGAALRQAQVAGRTTVWCPECQP